MKPVSQDAIAQLFEEARTHNAWRDEPVSDDMLRELYELTKWGPTSANTSPLRIVFVRSREARDKLLSVVAEGNRDKTRTAPVTAILAYDLAFYERLPELFPQRDMRPMFVGNTARIEATAFRNGSMQAAYFLLAARALGLDTGPLSGFDNAGCDAAFFAGTAWRSNLLCDLGHGDATKLFPRLPRLAFADACKIV